jgi:SagB-type dehydrogenase family enzyme
VDAKQESAPEEMTWLMESPAARLRRSRTIIFVLEETGFVMLNYLTRACVDCEDLALRLLTAADDWQEASALLAAAPGEPSIAAARLRTLVEEGFLVVEGSERAREDQAYEELWEWDVRAGLYHFSIKDAEWMTDAERLADLAERVEARETATFFTTNEGCQTVVALERPNLQQGVFPILSARRSRRIFRPEPIALEALRDSLYASFAITELAEEPVPGMGKNPLKMTPSGGARNPFEAYVYVRHVDGLPPGMYHYSALQHSLGLLEGPALCAPQELLAGQAWTDKAAALIFLVANFRRTMWKYSHPNVYRALYLEAGHIGQNIMVAATAHGLTAVPTAAILDSRVERLLGLDRVTQGCLYVLVLGLPDLNAPRGAY